MKHVLASIALYAAWVLAAPSPVHAASADHRALALTGARIFVSPGEASIPDGVVLIRNGRIEAVGSRGQIPVPPSVQSVDCRGSSLLAGFWNSHVHFIEDKWKGSATLPASQLTSQLQQMLTRHGFVHVFETATFNLDDTLALRRRISTGEVQGPVIYTVGVPFVPPNGTPVYLHPMKLPEVATAAEAESFVRRQLAAGVDGIKFFTVSPNSRTTLAAMPIPIAKAAVAAAHTNGKPVFAHPTNAQGVNLAVESGVDVLVHVSPDAMEPWDDALVRKMKDAEIALIPTLKLYEWDPARQGFPPDMIRSVVELAVGQLRQYSEAGGEILFGTDVGYVTDYDPIGEYLLMQRAGLTFEQILASLTTNPAARFGASARTGRIERGMDADLVVLRGDPSKALEALGKVQRVYAKGRLLYQAP